MWKESWRGSGGRGTQEAPRKSSGGTQEAPRRSPGAPRKHPGGTQEHPGGTQEAPRRHPGGSQGTRGVFDAKCSKTIEFYCKSDASDQFRVYRSDVTLTVPAACAQKLAPINVESGRTLNTHSQDTPPEPLQQRLLFGESADLLERRACENTGNPPIPPLPPI